MVIPQLRTLDLSAFKSHRSQRMSLYPVTLLVGRNGSGKSNVLDALSLLALLADERDVADLERGDQEVAGLRGGLSGAAPFGRGLVEIGCTSTTNEGEVLSLSLSLDPKHSEIVSEKLVLESRTGRRRVLVEADRQAAGSGLVDTKVYSAGAPRSYHFLSSRLATVQATTKIPQDTKARQLVVRCCLEILGALKGIFLLDPVPAQMRGYNRIGTAPERSGASLSSVAYELRSDKSAWSRLLELARGLVETRVERLDFSEGRLPDQRLIDVMLAMEEGAGTRKFTTPATLMSDGTLRYLSIVSSLLYLRQPQATALGPDSRTTLVIEEIENGLFPSQGARVLDLLRAEASSHDVSLLATTHSPALLDALKPEDHRGVYICERDDKGFSLLRPLVEHPKYLELATSGGIGRALTRGALDIDDSTRRHSLAEVFNL